jgi:hypothetical protein
MVELEMFVDKTKHPRLVILLVNLSVSDNQTRHAVVRRCLAHCNWCGHTQQVKYRTQGKH